MEVEQGDVFVDPFVHQDVGDYHYSFLSRYGSAFDPFGKVILHQDDILIPTYCPVERSYQVDRYSLIEGSMFGLFTVASYGSFAASSSCASLTLRLHILLHLWPVESSFYQGSSPYYSLMSSHSVVVACLENLGSERLAVGAHHLPLGIGCSLFPLAV